MAARVEAGMGMGLNEKVKLSMNMEVMSELVGSINATQINVICAKMATTIVERLGPRGKLIAAQAVASIKQSKREELDESEIIAQQIGDQYKNEQFLTNRRMAELKIEAIGLLQCEITSSFSTPRKFTEEGTSFVLSDHEPLGFIKEAAARCRIMLDKAHIPRSYIVKLELDEKTIKDNGKELVFALIETSCGKEVAKECFTIQELETERKRNVDMADSS